MKTLLLLTMFVIQLITLVIVLDIAKKPSVHSVYNKRGELVGYRVGTVTEDTK